MMAKPDHYLTGIDIGSSKVAVLIGQRDGSGGVEVVGKGMAPNRGTRRGNVVNRVQHHHSRYADRYDRA